MNTLTKILASIFLLFVGIMLGGIWPYIPGPGILISIGLFVTCIIGIVSIWKNKQS